MAGVAASSRRRKGLGQARELLAFFNKAYSASIVEVGAKHVGQAVRAHGPRTSADEGAGNAVAGLTALTPAKAATSLPVGNSGTTPSLRTATTRPLDDIRYRC